MLELRLLSDDIDFIDSEELTVAGVFHIGTLWLSLCPELDVRETGVDIGDVGVYFIEGRLQKEVVLDEVVDDDDEEVEVTSPPERTRTTITRPGTSSCISYVGLASAGRDPHPGEAAGTSTATPPPLELGSAECMHSYGCALGRLPIAETSWVASPWHSWIMMT